MLTEPEPEVFLRNLADVIWTGVKLANRALKLKTCSEKGRNLNPASPRKEIEPEKMQLLTGTKANFLKLTFRYFLIIVTSQRNLPMRNSTIIRTLTEAIFWTTRFSGPCVSVTFFLLSMGYNNIYTCANQKKKVKFDYLATKKRGFCPTHFYNFFIRCLFYRNLEIFRQRTL